MENFRPSSSVMYGANGYAHNAPMLFKTTISGPLDPKGEGD